jgi:hypothetical protein
MMEGRMANDVAVDNSKKSLVPVGVAAAATGAGGFAFGVFTQLGLAGLLAQQSRFALTIFCAASALILATGRATLPIEGVKHWVFDGITAMFALAAVVGIALVFMAPSELSTYARFDSSLAGNTDDPKLIPKVELGDGQFAALGSDNVPIKVTAGGGLAIRVENLETLLAQYAQDEERRKTESQRFALLMQSSHSAEK